MKDRIVTWALCLALAVPLAASANKGAMTLTGTDDEYAPLLTANPSGALFQGTVLLGSRFEHVSPYPVDIDGTELGTDLATDLVARVGLRFDSKRSMAPVGLGVRLEVDAITGTVSSAPTLEGEGLPGSHGYENVIRRANLRFSVGTYFHIFAGFMMSDFGMGLIANDGTHHWEPGNALFNDPHGGDRVLRGMIASGPLTAARMVIGVGYDQVQEDDITLHGDEANQIVGAIRFGVGKDISGGVYVAYRMQEAEDGATLDALAIDATVAAKIKLTDSISLKLEAEGALIQGETTLAPTPDFPTHDLLSLGAALRATLDAGVAGAVLDIFYASGDQNLDDKTQNAFKADQNYQLGFLLFRHTLAGQTGRAVFTASDPALTGIPSEDLDRFPTRGSMSNTIAIFPRGWWRPVDGLEIYGGPLLAFAEVALADPLRTKVNGGDPRNALGGDPGGYLGTELDLGIRYTGLLNGTEFNIGLEGGMLLPGSAFEDAAGQPMDTVFGGRLIVDYRL